MPASSAPQTNCRVSCASAAASSSASRTLRSLAPGSAINYDEFYQQTFQPLTISEEQLLTIPELPEQSEDDEDDGEAGEDEEVEEDDDDLDFGEDFF